MKHSRILGMAGAIVSAVIVGASVPAIAAMMAPPSIAITSPAMGATVRGSTIPVRVAIHNFHLECANIGKTVAPMGEGHVHVMVDGMDMAHLIGPFCSPNISINGQGIAAGKHMLTVVLATDAHAVSSMPVSVPFMYEPSATMTVPHTMTGGVPTLSVISPKNGATVGRHFQLVVGVKNFDLSCSLEGKRNIAGWGHLHVFVQQDAQTGASAPTPMVAMMKTPEGMSMGKMLMQKTGMSMDQLDGMMTMAMPGMIGMPCTTTIPVNLTSWSSGAAKIVVQFANNDHMPTMGAKPVVINVRVK